MDERNIQWDLKPPAIELSAFLSILLLLLVKPLGKTIDISWLLPVTSCIVDTAPPFILWGIKFINTILPPPPPFSLHIGGQRWQPIQMGHRLHIRGGGGGCLDNLLMSMWQKPNGVRYQASRKIRPNWYYTCNSSQPLRNNGGAAARRLHILLPWLINLRFNSDYIE
jgi:hypothetical protein